MRTYSPGLLRRVFEWKGQLAQGNRAATKDFGGIEIAPFKNNSPAAVSISADFEMAWGWRSRPGPECASKAANERRNVPSLLRALEEYRIPITWATVGHLFLESCTRGNCGLAHADMPRPPRNERWDGDWYRHDPCANVNEAPAWYAPDLIATILSSSVGHELASHSFSHIDFSVTTSTPELVRMEISACIKAMDPFGIRPRSLVFCHNRMGYQYSDLLYEMGIIVVRHRDSRSRLAYPERTASGLYKLYESMNLRLATYYNYVDKAKIFIDEAIRRGDAYHMWFHPSDEPNVFEEAFIPILDHIDSQRGKGLVWVSTMADLAAYCEAREKTTISAIRSQSGMTLTLESSLDTSKFGNPYLTLLIPLDRPVTKIVYDQDNDSQDSTAARRTHPVENERLILNVPCKTKRVQLFFS